MALRALTPSGTAYCSDCGAETPSGANECAGCGRTFEGVLEAVRCPFCAAILFRDATECYHCGREVEPPAPPPETEDARAEERLLKKLLSITEKAAEKALKAPPEATASPPPVPVAAPPVPLEATPALSEAPPAQSPEEEGAALWMLSEPFQRMLTERKKRVEQMDAIVARARRRIRMLETSQNPIEVREREELKRQVEEILVERGDIVKIEEGIMGMERIYRNILHLQQTQLRDREDALKTRVETFRKELEKRELEKTQIKEREDDLNRREGEFRSLVNRIQEREKDLSAREERLAQRVQDLEQKAARLGTVEDDLKRKAEAGGREQITIQPADAELRDMKLRLTELEEQMEKVVEEKNRLDEARQRASAFNEEVKAVLKVLDDLLDALPEDAVKKFSKTKDYEAYEKVLERLGL